MKKTLIYSKVFKDIKYSKSFLFNYFTSFKIYDYIKFQEKVKKKNF